jgi:polysaccharide export outer membrane protein
MKIILQFVIVLIIAAIMPLQAAYADILADVQAEAVKAVATESATKTPSGAVEAIADATYKIGPEDVLEISVWKEEGLRKEVLVRPDGGISFPLVGEVQAAGRTAEQIRGVIADELRKSINDPVVSVSVLKVAGNRIYVIGRVNKPGEFVAGRYIDVLQALSMAGGLTPYATENDIKVLRRRGGKEEVFKFRYSDIRRGNNLEQNITLQGGDVVLVP